METLLARHLLGKKVGLSPGANGRDITYKFLSSGYPGLPVVDAMMSVVGVVTEYDLLQAIKNGANIDEVAADKIMSGTPVVADIDTSAIRLIEMMIDNHLTIVPIVSKEKFVGVVSRQELLEANVDPFVRRLFRE